MRHVALIALSAACLLLASSWALAQGATQRASPATNPCPQHSANPRPGCPGSAENPVPAQTVFYTFCESGGVPMPGGPTTFYASDVFPIDTAPYAKANVPQPPPGTYPFPWMNEFTQYVSQTYARGGKITLTCTTSNTEAEARANLDMVMRSGTPGRLEVTQTGWKYAPATPIPPPNAAAAVATVPPPTAAATPSRPAPTAGPQPRVVTPKTPPEKPVKKPL